MQINTRENKTIWSIFNEEKKLININGRNNFSDVRHSVGIGNALKRNNTMPYNNKGEPAARRLRPHLQPQV